MIILSSNDRQKEKEGKKETQKSENIENEKSFLDEIKSIFLNILRAIIRLKKKSSRQTLWVLSAQSPFSGALKFKYLCHRFFKFKKQAHFEILSLRAFNLGLPLESPRKSWNLKSVLEIPGISWFFKRVLEFHRIFVHYFSLTGSVYDGFPSFSYGLMAQRIF